ncbi:hypothetical protein RZS08_00145, partial [Arthrospira platensis SPKY1]|nr:hypothetical protein [Arthrospira platensis SPKY1]
LFAGWKLDRKLVFNEITNNNNFRFHFKTAFFFIIRFIAPVAILLVFLNGLGFFGFFSGGDL